jgi:hypothetical protein
MIQDTRYMIQDTAGVIQDINENLQDTTGMIQDIMLRALLRIR